ncbi:unnamed protein product [Cunninghamella blakesleeana]
MKLILLPYEIISAILFNLSIKDLVRMEATCKCIQTWVLYEMEKRIKTGSLQEDWNLLIHLGQIVVTPARFDIYSKKVFYSVPKNPIRIKSMYDHRQHIHCTLSRMMSDEYTSSMDGVKIIIEPGMKEGWTEYKIANGHWCQINVTLTKLNQKEPVSHQRQQLGWLAPLPFIYSIQVDEVIMPLSKLLEKSI